MCGVEVLSDHRLSHVDRLHLPGGRIAVYKTAVIPLTGEIAIPSALDEQDMPVPRVHEAAMVDGVLGMLLDDLGVSTREPNLGDAGCICSPCTVSWASQRTSPTTAPTAARHAAVLQRHLA